MLVYIVQYNTHRDHGGYRSTFTGLTNNGYRFTTTISELCWAKYQRSNFCSLFKNRTNDFKLELSYE